MGIDLKSYFKSYYRIVSNPSKPHLRPYCRPNTRHTKPFEKLVLGVRSKKKKDSSQPWPPPKLKVSDPKKHWMERSEFCQRDCRVHGVEALPSGLCFVHCSAFKKCANPFIFSGFHPWLSPLQDSLPFSSVSFGFFQSSLASLLVPGKD